MLHGYVPDLTVTNYDSLVAWSLPQDSALPHASVFAGLPCAHQRASAGLAATTLSLGTKNTVP